MWWESRGIDDRGLGHCAVVDGETSSMVGLQNSIIELTPFKKAIKGITKINTELLKVSDIMSI